jgi:hypothetical protein
MYNKFRTVSMALIVLQVALPMLGFIVLDRIMKNHYEKDKLFKAGTIAMALTAGFCLISIMFPGIAGSFSTASDTAMLEGWPTSYQEEFAYAISADRMDLMTSDATRSLMLILIAAALLALPYLNPKFENAKSRKILAVCVIAIVLFDLWSVGKRYLNEENFVTPRSFTAAYKPSQIDNFILEDKEPGFRVLSIPGFTSAIPSYHHRCIGGYSAVKMQRYDDLLKYYLNQEVQVFKEYESFLFEKYEDGDVSEDEIYATLDYIMESMMPITSMLNGRYIIGNHSLYHNAFAQDNCWFVENCVSAATPDDEIDLIGTEDMWKTAVIGDDFAWARKHFEEVELESDYAASDVIYLTHYAPNELRYNYTTYSERAAIFSEIFYPKGWKAWIEPAGAYGEVVDGRYQPTTEGKEIELFRANWILRGAIIPAGEGQLIMRFEPESYRTGENISRISSILLILMLLGTAGGAILLNRSKSN